MKFKCPECGMVDDGSSWTLTYTEVSYRSVSMKEWLSPENLKDPDWGRTYEDDNQIEEIRAEHECGYDVLLYDTHPEGVLEELKRLGIVIEE